MQSHDDIYHDILELSPDIVINDRLDTSKAYMISLTKVAQKVINFEDLGEGSTMANLVINAMYPEGRVMANHYHGSKYFILRDEFLFEKEKKVQTKIENILLSFGGVDPNDYTRRVLTIIFEYCKMENINITVVTGLGYRNSDTLIRDFPMADIKVDVKNMSEEIYKSDLVFTSAGRTTFEVASIGVPCIVLCQNNRETTHFFASEQNGFNNLGLGFKVSDEDIFNAFLNSKDYRNRVAMHERMISKDLKNGKRRVLNLIRKTIEHD
jgi:spore coat polysaccharide biosynthesis predicted glycosyltransferase SpsG